jgi:hypothetical protein
MKEYIPPEQLLTRILHVAQLLAYTESSNLKSIRVDQYVEPIMPSIIVAKDNSGENAEKLSDEEKM